MALTIIKNTPIHVVVAITGGGETTTVNLNETLKTSMQVPTTPVVNIGAIHWSIPSGNATIARNSITLWTLSLSDYLGFDGFSDNRENTSNIIVTLPESGGTVILELLKISGYGDSQHLNQAYDVTPTTTTTEAP